MQCCLNRSQVALSLNLLLFTFSCYSISFNVSSSSLCYTLQTQTPRLGREHFIKPMQYRNFCACVCTCEHLDTVVLCVILSVVSFCVYSCAQAFRVAWNVLTFVSLGNGHFTPYWGQFIDVSNSKESCYEKQFTDRKPTLSHNTFLLSLFAVAERANTLEFHWHCTVPRGHHGAGSQGPCGTHTLAHANSLDWKWHDSRSLGPAVCACSVCEKRLCRET